MTLCARQTDGEHGTSCGEIECKHETFTRYFSDDVVVVVVVYLSFVPNYFFIF